MIETTTSKITTDVPLIARIWVYWPGHCSEIRVMLAALERAHRVYEVRK